MVLEETKESSWNMAMAYLQRMDIILQEMNYYSANENNYDWYKSSLNLFKELSPKMDIETLKKHQAQHRKIQNKVNNARLVAMQVYQRPDYSNLSELLTDWDVMLRKTMEDLKLISPSKDDPRFAIRG
jgi:hypothetical protein